MGKIVKEMRNKVPETFFGLQVLLTANVTISSYYFSPTIQTFIFLALGKMGQIVKFSLK